MHPVRLGRGGNLHDLTLGFGLQDLRLRGVRPGPGAPAVLRAQS